MLFTCNVLHFVLQAEVEKREQKLDSLQERVTELKERAKLQETPLQMQVNVEGKRNVWLYWSLCNLVWLSVISVTFFIKCMK